VITETQLQQIMPRLAADKLGIYLPFLNAAMERCGIDRPLRVAAFVAQLAHESGEFRWMEEIWGPTAAQQRYEPPGDLARQLGNSAAGDGARFKGRGPIQITGRANYQKFGGLLGIDLVGAPPRAAQPDVAFDTAGLFWRSNGLNELADSEQFVAITRRINGGTNGLAQRQAYYDRARAVLGITAPAARGGPEQAPLARGFEAIRAHARRAGAGAAPKKAVAAKKAPAAPRAARKTRTASPAAKRPAPPRRRAG
jgi:predicted chitinase